MGSESETAINSRGAIIVVLGSDDEGEESSMVWELPFQKEVGRLLVGIGVEWVKEFVADWYTLDAVIVDKKLALEIE